MKKLLTTFLLSLLVLSATLAQQSIIKVTVTPNKDTVRDEITIQTSVKAYNPPIIIPTVVIAPVISAPGLYPLPTFLPLPAVFNAQTKTLTITGQVGGKITGYSFNMNMDSVTCLILNNCNNVEVTGNRFTNSRNFGIEVNNGSNINIHDNYFTNLANGVQIYKSPSCKVNNNQILNINGNMPMVGHAIFFNYCPASGGQQANYNLIVNESSVAQNPHDQIGFYNSL